MPAFLALCLLVFGSLNPPAADATAPVTDSTDVWDRFSLEGYGTINYFAFDWDTDPERPNVVDLERFVLYPGVRFSERVSLLGEIEFEHGGTGVTKELDKFEEFGEFEDEIEAGGEVLLEQLNVRIGLRPGVALRIGKFKLPIGLAALNDEPQEYFATTRAEAEASTIPTNWYEIGVQAEGRVGPVAYSAAVVNGLNSAEFSAENWVVRGRQTKFETVAAEDFAFSGRLDYYFGDESFAGVSGYIGDSADNRRKSTLDEDGETVSAVVSIVDGHLQWQQGPWTGRAVLLYGHLENADVVSATNRNLSRNLNAKGTPVGSELLAYRVEAGYDLLALLGASGPQRLDVFGRFSFYDTHFSTEGDVTDNALWERTVYTGGVNYRLLDGVVFKAQYDHRERGRGRVISGARSGTTENTISLGMGIQF